ncbi:MAG: hypothetical protein A3F84_22930 [Candidatus Handelsmanbacteria bacterium RIFCSPLOWO2_12_FULL_64_10]|uniref:Uncharacterized protein n=1 Tax=Handelsmanbacteria sp. (strain RIFCSPLOWO2_12_FULL_64_10) TaxID=1817868 RepID=A0A1F6C749_HANXR|nr:MAG: hypothetical protein A3F84_22930 [Candidatus Handelsmanbacteria bacterium RIFCSPLOWO2_12_FULL_64_10]
MNRDEMTERITEALERGIQESIEGRDVEPFRKAAVTAYRLRAGAALGDEEIARRVFPSDVEQVVRLSLRVVETDREKASSLFKGALDQVLSRLSAAPEGRRAEIQKKSLWKFWKR